MKKTLVLAICCALIYSCSPKTKATATETPKPVSKTTTSETSVQPAAESASVVDMATAEKTFRQVCSGCHDLIPANQRTAAEWPGIVNNMQSRSQAHNQPGFSNSDKANIIAYLTANAKK